LRNEKGKILKTENLFFEKIFFQKNELNTFKEKDHSILAISVRYKLASFLQRLKK